MFADRFDPYRAFEFTLVVDGKSRAGFHECFGLMPPSGSPHPKPPGRLFLKRGATADAEFWGWRRANAQRDGSIVVRYGDTEMFRCRFLGGRIAKWAGPDFEETGSEVPIETLELLHDGIDIEE
jgi:hypothetical protein